VTTATAEDLHKAPLPYAPSVLPALTATLNACFLCGVQMNLDLALGQEWEDPVLAAKKKKKGITAVVEEPDPAADEDEEWDPNAVPKEIVEEKEWTVEELMAPLNYLSESRFGGLRLPRKARTPTPDTAGVGSLDLLPREVDNGYRAETPVNEMHQQHMTLQPLSPQQRRKMKKAERDAHDKALAKQRAALKAAAEEALANYASFETHAQVRLETSLTRFRSPEGEGGDPPG